MATLSITANDGDIITTLQAAAGAAGFAATNAGVKAMTVAFLKDKYREQKAAAARIANAAAVDAAVATATTDVSAGIS